jgi:hypothetical protein
MPRYKPQIKNNSFWGMLPNGMRIAIIIGGLVLAIALATLFAKGAFKSVPVVYTDTLNNELLTRRALINKVNELQSTVSSYDARLSTLNQIDAENIALKAELGRPGVIKGTLAHVLTFPNRSFYDTMLIDAGSAEGIQENMIAYAFGSVALGTISSVTAHTSTIQLYSTPSREISGTAVGSDVAVTLIGRGGGEYEVRLPRDVPFTVGATVALQSSTPATLATVEKIITDPRDPFQRLLAKAPVNLQALKWVVVK